MLLGFRVANFRSLRDEHALSFTRPRAQVSGMLRGPGETSVFPVVGVHGADASGKSNVLLALRALRAAVLDSVTLWPPGGGVPREPFLLDVASRGRPTRFEVDIAIAGVRWTYGVELSDLGVEAEWLHGHPGGARTVCFDRRGTSVTGDGPSGALVDRTRPNALLLTVGAAFNVPELVAVHRWFVDAFRLVSGHDDVAERRAATRELLCRPGTGERYRRWVESLLQVADLGIVGVELVDDQTWQQVRLLHRGSRGPVALDLATQESLGTHAWFAFLGPLVETLERGSVLLADELHSTLHPLLAAEVLRLFSDRHANPRGAQLLFTTHTATLPGTGTGVRPLHPHQMWLTERAVTGETNLYPMAETSARRKENGERGHPHGRHGGVPRAARGDVTCAVGRHARPERLDEGLSDAGLNGELARGTP